MKRESVGRQWQKGALSRGGIVKLGGAALADRDLELAPKNPERTFPNFGWQ